MGECLCVRSCLLGYFACVCVLEGTIRGGDGSNVDSCVAVVDNDDGTMTVMVIMMLVMMMTLSFIALS